ncbi:ACT domain-containing protein [Citromicrobium bathyomarinum]
MTRNTPSLEHIRIEFACEEGALRRTLGVIEARGFSVRSMQMGSDGDRAVMTLALAPMDPSRRIDTLLRQLDRVCAVENAIHLSNDTRVAEVVHVANG